MLLNNLKIVFRIFIVALSCNFFLSFQISFASEDIFFTIAEENGRLANEGFSRSINFVNAWLEYADPQSGLIPKNLDWQEHYENYKKGGKDLWNANDNAADNYTFMVLTTAYTDVELFNGPMRKMLEAETRLTSRINSLPDDYSFSKQNFKHSEPNINRIMFGASEYVKDGLLAITEWLGPSTPWFDRMLSILDDMWEQAPIDTPYGKIVSRNLEINGEMLQVLSRVYWLTGKKKYLNWAIRLGDYYLLGNHHPTRTFTKLKLRDHGSEIISGLCELYATLSFAMPDKKMEYDPPLHDMLDRILEIGRNPDNLFYVHVNPQTGTHLDDNLADTWGYILNDYYTVYLIDGTVSYRQAVLDVFTNLDKYKNYNWERGSMDGYADAIEGALTLYNREPVFTVAQWIDSEIKVMWKYQKPSGLIEGWHCDGNFARTSLMYSLWKTMGTKIQPWRQDVQFGAVKNGKDLFISISSQKAWEGKIFFDSKRHKTYMNMPLDWPRINQLPEWYTVDPDKNYILINNTTKSESLFSGHELINGINIKVLPGAKQKLQIKQRDESKGT
jgi:hypothetical protein